MTGKHTSGPWYTELITRTATGLRGTIILARTDSHWPSGGRTIAEVGHWRDRVDPEADAYLIAAAPELLEVLEAFLNGDASVTHMKVTYEDARLAVARAKGEM
jgi:hypothetical protein